MTDLPKSPEISDRQSLGTDFVTEPIPTPTLGEYLKTHRLRSKKSLRDLGIENGLSSSHLSQIERGRVQDPKLSTLVTVAKQYNIPVTVILADVYGVQTDGLDQARAAQIGNIILALPEEAQRSTIDWAIYQQKHAPSR